VTAAVPAPRASRFEDVDDLTLLACLVWGEARGETAEGRLAVAWVVRNRRLHPSPSRFGATWQAVMLRPYRFSCFLASDPNSRKMLSPTTHGTPEVWRQCYLAAAAVYFNLSPDPTGGADHYHTAGVAPVWSKGRQPTAVIGHHRFFKLG
jgi:N-acetylmuramoyl-L-alanine amidase